MNSQAQEPSTVEQQLVWILGQMIRSSRIRGEYFKHINEFYSRYITSNVVPDPTTQVVTKNKEIYDAIHADFIFRVLGVIESFQGALAAAWKFTAKGKRDLKKILAILIDPKGHRGNIEGILKENTISEKQICRMFAFPLLTSFDKETEVELRKILDEVFNRLMDCAWYSQKFWDAYEDIRHIFAHNFRFIFLESVEPEWTAIHEESILAFLKDSDDLWGMSFIGASQRVAMGDLVYLLLELERWIYVNIGNTILNDGKAVLPKYVPYLKEYQQKEYEEVRNAQGYDISGQSIPAKKRINVDRQTILIIEFLGLLDKWERPLRVYGKDGKEFRFPVKKYQQDLKKKLDMLAEK